MTVCRFCRPVTTEESVQRKYYFARGRLGSVVNGTSLATVIGEVRINNLRVRRFADTEAVRTIGLVWAESSLSP